jgi:CheY-like chemotaxis protein
MPAGGTIEMSARNISIGDKEHQMLQKGNYVRISIKDQGIGISKKMLSRIFDPFFTTKPKGHGLGLATCYSIINRHGGAIDVESVLDEGSTFHIYLLASPEAAILAAATGINHKGSGRILIMDDEEIFRMYGAKFLTTLGYSVVCTEDGKETLNLFIEETKAGRPFAAIILDLIIPGGTGGKETIVEIRKLNTEIPVFVVSGYAEDPVMADPADYGFTDSLSKPFSMEELSEMLNKNLKK